ncbi:MAG: DCC1-like thiol-disulfide oxidoreductase family protein [Armatimonadota bacterium]|nr:DCC1-like thiol-disulfide oxidoreductase family protein [Armatimonadota bacterium]
MHRLRDRLGLTVFYDGACALCVRTVGWLARIDLLSLIRYEDFRESGVVERAGVDPRAAECRIQCVTASGARREGIDVAIHVALRLPPLWPLVPWLAAARLIGGQRAYDAIATRRPTPAGSRARCHQG